MKSVCVCSFDYSSWGKGVEATMAQNWVKIGITYIMIHIKMGGSGGRVQE